MPEETTVKPMEEDVVPNDVFASTDYQEWRDAMSQLYLPTLDAAADEPFRAEVNGFLLGAGTLKLGTYGEDGWNTRASTTAETRS